MGTLFLAGVLLMLAIGAWVAPLPEVMRSLQRLASAGLVIFAAVIGIAGGVSYNDAGYCVHNRTIFGSETAKCDLGWYFSAWGHQTEWAHYITVSHTLNPAADNETELRKVSDLPLYTIRMADNWTGTIQETTRFGIPQDAEQFLKMARDFRSPERLIVTTLRPAVTSSLDSVANLYTMEEYWAQGKRDEFKTEFEDAVRKGRPAIDRQEITVDPVRTDVKVAPSDSEAVDDSSETGGNGTTRVVTTKRINKETGEEIRIQHDFLDYGISVSSAIVENLDPDDKFEDRIQERKEAQSRRIVAKDRRLEEEEQRLLAITKSEREIAERQGKARVEQIEKTTNADTEKKLALVASEKMREQARIEKETASINLDKAKIDAQSVQVTADANAYQREKLLQADNALQSKLDAEKEIQRYWADAYARRSVPGVMLGDSGSNTVGSSDEATRFMQMLTIDAAKRLNYDRSIKTETAQ